MSKEKEGVGRVSKEKEGEGRSREGEHREEERWYLCCNVTL